MRYCTTYLFLILFFGSCNSLNDAKQVIVEADSLRTEGLLYGDSIKIADAVNTLGKTKYIFPTDFAKANYYYGRLLNEKGHQADAMKCFIIASHTTTHDYNILGSVYCNIGIMCHLIGNYSLSYSMYEKSSIQFQKAKNIPAYHYALNDMAFELAEENKKEEALKLLNKIETECVDSNVVYLSYRTKALVYYNTCAYDSALCYVDKELSRYKNDPTGYVIKAQLLWSLNKYDSAIQIAKQVMDMEYASPNDKYNMLYILTYNDTSLNAQQIKVLSEERADIDKEIIDPNKQKLAEAVQYLKQDLENNNPHKKVIRSITIVLIILILLILIIITQSNYRIKHKNLRKEIDVLQRIENQQQNYKKNRINQLLQICDTFQHSHDFKREICWNDYNMMCEIANRNLYMIVTKLKHTHLLNEKEIRLCILVLIGGFSSKQQAELLYYSESGIRNFKSNTAKKLGTSSKNLHDFLVELAICG